MPADGGGTAGGAPPSDLAGYPTRAVSVSLDGLDIRLVTVADLAAYVDTAALLRDADAPEPPYWAHLWPGSRALARRVAAGLARPGQRVLEVGCGLALAGIAAALRGAAVTLLDAAPEAAAFARANAARNACRAGVVVADLSRPPLRGRFDLCLAADVTYDPFLQQALATLLYQHLAPGGVAVCAESVRTFDQRFQQACVDRGLTVEEEEAEEPDDGRPVRIRMTTVRAPAP